MDLERYSKLRESLIDSGDGIFIAKSDPHLWHKYIKRKPDDVVAMYHVGLSLEKEARKNLSRYKETKLIYYYFRYKKKLRESLEMLQKSWHYGYIPAGKEIIRINSENKRKEDAPKTRQWLLWIGAFLLLMLCFFVGAFLSILFFSSHGDFVKEINQEYYTYMLPYHVVEARPSHIPEMDYEEKIVSVGQRPTKERIINQLVSTIKTMYQHDPETPKKVLAVSSDASGQSEVGMSLWTGKNSDIDVYLYPPNSPHITNQHDQGLLLWETTTVLRSAIYQYNKHHGHMPSDLAELTRPFPENFLSSVPKEPFQWQNSVHPTFNGGGGWIYSPQSTHWSEVIKPNLPVTNSEKFEPLQLVVYKPDNLLSVLSGNRVIRTYPVAIGKENKTPEGLFFIAKKIMLTKAGPYGNRVLELSDPTLAIHGTNRPEVIGKNVTLGCIRLSDTEMKDLYAITPLYTEVTITNKRTPLPSTETPQTNPVHDKKLLVSAEGPYAKENNPKEVPSIIAQNWRG